MPSNLVVAVLGTARGCCGGSEIAKAGLGLRVWNREPELAAPLGALCAVICSTPARQASARRRPHPARRRERCREAMDQARDGLAGGSVSLEVCTVSPDGSHRLAHQATQLGVGYVEAPLLGTKEPAVAGTLTILAAASQAQARERVQPVLDAVGSRTVWLDEVGQPSSLKLAYNTWVLTTVEGLAESLTLADALGVDPKLVAEVIRGSALDSGYVQAKAPKMISDDLDTPSFPLVAAAKDAVLITDAARAAGLCLGIAETVRERLQLAVESGFGRADVAATCGSRVETPHLTQTDCIRRTGI